MPISKITTNFELEDESRFVDDFYNVLKEVLKIPKHDRLVIVNQLATGFFQPLNTTGRYILLEITLFAGRTIQTKRELYKRLVEFATSRGIDPSNVRIILYEVEQDNWGIRGGQAASDVELGFDTNV